MLEQILYFSGKCSPAVDFEWTIGNLLFTDNKDIKFTEFVNKNSKDMVSAARERKIPFMRKLVKAFCGTYMYCEALGRQFKVNTYVEQFLFDIIRELQKEKIDNGFYKHVMEVRRFEVSRRRLEMELSELDAIMSIVNEYFELFTKEETLANAAYILALLFNIDIEISQWYFDLTLLDCNGLDYSKASSSHLQNFIKMSHQ